MTNSIVKIAAIQMTTGLSLDNNRKTAEKRIKSAVANGAIYVQTPEMTSYFAKSSKGLMANIAPWDNNPCCAYFSDLARELGIHLHIGSIAIKLSNQKAANRSVLFGPDGKILSHYDKIHMFDVDINGDKPYRESDRYQAGETAKICALPFGRVGFSICYDVRFASLYRALAKGNGTNDGAQIIAVPAAFTATTGQAHWESLLRTRAIETGCFIIASAQVGTHENGRQTHGHSMIINPWGKIIAEAQNEDEWIGADIDLGLVDKARRSVPSLMHDVDFGCRF